MDATGGGASVNRGVFKAVYPFSEAIFSNILFYFLICFQCNYILYVLKIDPVTGQLSARERIDREAVAWVNLTGNQLRAAHGTYIRW